MTGLRRDASKETRETLIGLQDMLLLRACTTVSTTDSLSIYQCSSVQLLQMSHADHAPRDVLADHPALLQALGTTGMSDRLQTTTTGKHPARDQCLLLRNLPALEDHARQADGQCHQHR